MQRAWWWARQVFLTTAAAFFLVFGIELLIAAYALKDPAYFVLTFFASNLIILISAVLLAGFIWRMIKAFRRSDERQVTSDE